MAPGDDLRLLLVWPGAVRSVVAPSTVVRCEMCEMPEGV